MYYRIKDNEIFDYADYEYAKECQFTALCTMSEFDKNKDNYIISNGQIILNPDLEQILQRKRQQQFESDFFLTTLGWIRRKVNMKDGTAKDFLSDILLSVKAGLELGQNVELITYQTPDFTKELTAEYLKSLQEIKSATAEFIQECLFQTVNDFWINEGGNNGVSD